MIGNCARRVVTCVITTPNGKTFTGKNWCSNAQVTCPRKEDEDYTKCKTICQQWGHAEEVALTFAGQEAMGAKATIQGHSYACRSCQEALFSAGVKSVSVDIESPVKKAPVVKAPVVKAPVQPKPIQAELLPFLPHGPKQKGRRVNMERNERLKCLLRAGYSNTQIMGAEGCSFTHLTKMRKEIKQEAHTCG